MLADQCCPCVDTEGVEIAATVKFRARAAAKIHKPTKFSQETLTQRLLRRPLASVAAPIVVRMRCNSLSTPARET
jgi:hypothetical protein